MPLVYETKAARIRCDYCDRTAPVGKAAEEGWMKHGVIMACGDTVRWYCCPDHAHHAHESAARWA